LEIDIMLNMKSQNNHRCAVNKKTCSCSSAETACTNQLVNSGSFKVALIISLCFLLVTWGCGGGGGGVGGDGGEEAPLPNISPVANAGVDQVTYEARSVALVGTASDSDGTIVSHQWTQTGGTTVALSGVTTPTLSFTSPSTTETLTFSYAVTDNAGAQAADTVSVHVSEVLFSDSFSFNVLSASWILEDNSGNPSSWTVPSGSGELYQQASVNDGAFIESYHTGTFRYLDNPAFSGGSAYRFSVDITPRTNSNDREGNDVGIMFGYTGVDDYYRLTMNARYGFTRLERRSAAGFTTLAVNSIGYVDDQQLNVTLELNEGTAVILIDGEPVFAESNLVISPAGTIALYCQDRASFDNVVIAENSPQPLVALSSPLAHSVSLTPGEGDVLPARAVVLNKPVGGSVLFSVDGGAEIGAAESVNPYTASLGVTAGDHDVDAILKDADGNEIYRDINAVVGVGGGYTIAVGDSITNGIGDENPLNNDSLDGRVVSRQGFQAQLVDDLTDATGLPQIVFNEGLPGTTLLNWTICGSIPFWNATRGPTGCCC
jgi:hypothetical protein